MALSFKQLAFINEYLTDFNGTQAAIRAGYSEKGARTAGSELLANPNILAEIRARVNERAMSADEVLLRLGEEARGNLGSFFKLVERETENPLPTEEILGEETRVKIVDGEDVEYTVYCVRKVVLDTSKIVDPRYSNLLQEFTDSPRDGMGIKIVNKLSAQQILAKVHRLDSDENKDDGQEIKQFSLPADVLASSFLDAYDDIKEHLHTEYIFHGGRGSTKSSFISLAIIWQLVNNPTVHALALRQVGNTLHDSVYAQLTWAIDTLGLTEKFKCTTSPLRIEYKPTHQKIYFRGADKPEKIKSIKPRFGHIGILWLEELDQFHGEEAVRKIEQSVIRGGDLALIFKSFNPPRTANNWANKYVKIPKATQYQHKSTYLDLGLRVKWLGKAFVEEAEHLKAVNPGAYEHEYQGVANSAGGLVFENVQLRTITDEEIAQFDRVMWGGDWGYYPDPADFGPVHYDAARRILYLFGEYRAWKQSNKKLYENLMRTLKPGPDATLILDSAEPKSVADFTQYARDGIELLDDSGNPVLDVRGKPVLIYGPTCRGAEKGADSVTYSIKWLQGLTAIVIDNERCPYAAEEFTTYEYEQDPDGNFISEYPDKANHSIDRVRYACNMTWRRKGQ
jgi:phage terminase large subunit